MPATEALLDQHIIEFDLQRVPAGGADAQRIVEQLPESWLPVARSQMDFYSNRRVQPPTKDGEFTFILMHDKLTGHLYFYYDLNF
jgi:hypothetical protein